MKKKVIITILVIAVLVVGLVGLRLRGRGPEVEQEEMYVPVEVEKAVKETIGNRILLNGAIHAKDEAMVMPMMQGKVEVLHVKLGDYVEKDQILMVVDQANSLRSLEQAEKSMEMAQQDAERAEAGVEQGIIGVENARDQYEDAQATLKRVRSLYEAGAASLRELEQAELAANSRQLESAESQLRQAEIGYQQALNQVAQAEISYRQATDALEDTVVRAPMSGVITSLNVVAGEMAGGSQPVAEIADIDSVYFQANVAENIINNMEIDDKVMIKIPASELEISGTVGFISQTLDAETQLYMIRVYLDNQDRQIRTGMSATAEMNLNIREGVLAVNRRAVIERDGETYVFIVEEDRAIRKDVSLGLESDTVVEILEGLNEGASVIVKGQHYLSDGDVIRVVGGE